MLETPITRRQLLKWSALGIGSAVLAACTPAATAVVEPTKEPEVDVEEPTAEMVVEPTAEPIAVPVVEAVIVTTGWPLGIMPDEATQEADPSQKVYAQVLGEWLDKHPGVTLESSNVNIWSSQDIATAIAGGTAPMYFSGGALGNWSDGGQIAAFAQGLAADVTDLMAKYKVAEKTIEPAVTRWNMYKIAGRFYSVPQEFNVGNGIYYRIDLLKEAGFDIPKSNWTWDDYRAMAKAMTKGTVKGGVAQVWGSAFPIQAFAGGSDGQPFMELPSLSTAWHYKYKHDAQPVVDALTFYRAMLMEDQSILTDATFTDDQVTGVFNRGEAGFMFNNAGWYVLPGELGIEAIEKVVGKDRAEVVGWINHPLGNNGGLSGTQSFVHNMTLDPNASPELLELGYDLYDYFTYGDGFLNSAKGNYEVYKDLRKVFTAVPMVNGISEVEGIPGTVTDAWPKHYLDAVTDAANLPQTPGKGMYLPPETNPAPPDSAYQDAINKIAFDVNAGDVTGLLTEASALRNQQAETYSSAISAEDFKTGVTKYYTDYSALIKSAVPDYYANVWAPFYDEFIAPELA